MHLFLRGGSTCVCLFLVHVCSLYVVRCVLLCSVRCVFVFAVVLRLDESARLRGVVWCGVVCMCVYL